MITNRLVGVKFRTACGASVCVCVRGDDVLCFLRFIIFFLVDNDDDGEKREKIPDHTYCCFMNEFHEMTLYRC